VHDWSHCSYGGGGGINLSDQRLVFLRRYSTCMAGSTVPAEGTKPERPAVSVSTGILNVNGGGVIVPTV
jgi:hypothetical protein